MRDISIIIPCAGIGSRLGAPYPKELFAIENGVSLIDYSFDIIRSIKDFCQVIIVMSSEKMELVRYLHKYQNDFEIYFIYQKNKFSEMLGALKSAELLLGETNLLLLPDIIIDDRNKGSKINKIILKAKETGFSFGAAKERRCEILRKMGAMSTNNDQLVRLIDKPQLLGGNTSFDSFWVTLAWEKKFFSKFIEDFKLIYSNKWNEKMNIYRKPVIFFDNAVDLGTWENISLFFANNNSIKKM